MKADYPIIDAHAHLWLRQDSEVEGKKIETLTNGRSLFMGEIRQMVPPFITDGRNTAEIFLSNMDYAQVSAAVIGMEKLMWGSDYPRTITAITYRMSYDFLLRSSLLRDEENEMFLSSNARRFYGFNNLKELPYIKNMSE